MKADAKPTPHIDLTTERTLMVRQAFPLKPLNKSLDPDYTLKVESVRCTASMVLDSYDQSLLREQQILVLAGQQIACCNARALTFAKQNASPQRKNDIDSKTLRRRVSQLDARRELIVQRHGPARLHRLTMMDDEGKTCARGRVMELKTPQGWLSFIDLDPLRGYRDASTRFLAEILHCCKRPSNTFPDVFPTLGLQLKPGPELPKLHPRQTIKTSCTELFTSFFAQARSNEEGIIEDQDSECLHQYRVQLRKTRALLKLCQGVYSEDAAAAVSQRFESLMKPTGALRDLDVLLLQEPALKSGMPEDQLVGYDRLFRYIKRQRQREWRKLSRHLQSKAYRQKAAALQKVVDHPDKLESGELAEMPSVDYARLILQKRLNKVLRKSGQAVQSARTEDLHQLRLHCKKMRYLMESFLPLFPKKKMKAAITRLKGLQNALGELNDRQSQFVHIRALLDRHANTSAPDPQMIEAGGAVLARLHQWKADTLTRADILINDFRGDNTQAIFKALTDQEKSG